MFLIWAWTRMADLRKGKHEKGDRSRSLPDQSGGLTRKSFGLGTISGTSSLVEMSLSELVLKVFFRLRARKHEGCDKESVLCCKPATTFCVTVISAVRFV
jgi:hypothetical protein